MTAPPARPRSDLVAGPASLLPSRRGTLGWASAVGAGAALLWLAGDATWPYAAGMAASAALLAASLAVWPGAAGSGAVATPRRRLRGRRCAAVAGVSVAAAALAVCSAVVGWHLLRNGCGGCVDPVPPFPVQPAPPATHAGAIPAPAAPEKVRP